MITNVNYAKNNDFYQKSIRHTYEQSERIFFIHFTTSSINETCILSLYVHQCRIGIQQFLKENRHNFGIEIYIRKALQLPEETNPL